MAKLTDEYLTSVVNDESKTFEVKQLAQIIMNQRAEIKTLRNGRMSPEAIEHAERQVRDLTLALRRAHLENNELRSR
jgi:hypothetical protein